MIETDVIVVGSGPAGSSAAKHAALGGAKVILMDKKSEIGSPKRCAEGVSIQGLEKLGIEEHIRYGEHLPTEWHEIKVEEDNNGVTMIRPIEVKDLVKMFEMITGIKNE